MKIPLPCLTRNQVYHPLLYFLDKSLDYYNVNAYIIDQDTSFNADNLGFLYI